MVEAGSPVAFRGFDLDCGAYRAGARFRQNVGRALWNEADHLSCPRRNRIFSHLFWHIPSYEELYEKISRPESGSRQRSGKRKIIWKKYPTT